MSRSLSWVVWLGIIYLIGAAFVFVSCGRYDNMRAPSSGGESDKARKSVYVESVVAPALVSQSHELEISVSGNLPSPAYSFSGFDVDVRDGVIEITPLADFDEAKMAAQVLVPFDRVCIVKDLRPGSYEVRVVGRTGEIQSRRVEVTAKR